MNPIVEGTDGATYIGALTFTTSYLINNVFPEAQFGVQHAIFLITYFVIIYFRFKSVAEGIGLVVKADV